MTGRDEPAAVPQEPLDDNEQLRKDTSYSPASDAETAAKQADPMPDGIDDDIDLDQVRVVPGTGGPDDAGDVEVTTDDVDLPHGHD